MELDVEFVVTTQHKGDERKGLKKRVRQCWSFDWSILGWQLREPGARSQEPQKVSRVCGWLQTDEGGVCLMKLELWVGGGLSMY